jgi:signal transduction histidine kinase
MMTTTVAETDLARVIQTYNDVSERLKRSHELLGREVCRLRQELQAKNRELERRERLAALGEMAAGVAHEIRNPLGGIGLYASLLERDLEDRPQAQDIVRRISLGVRNMETVVGDILAFASESEPHCRPTQLADLLDAALTQTAPQARALGIDVDVDEAAADLVLHCDGPRIERALMNLMLNALDAVGEGGQVWIRTEAAENDGLVPLIVEDNGPGVPAEIVHRIFNPFFTTKDSGTGLGLAIAHRIAESHGGRLTVGQGRCGGAAFRLYVPAADRLEWIECTGGSE